MTHISKLVVGPAFLDPLFDGSGDCDGEKELVEVDCVKLTPDIFRMPLS